MTARSRISTRRPRPIRRLAVAAILIGCMLGATPSPAQAAESRSEAPAAAAPADVTFYAGAAIRGKGWRYGASEPPARRLSVGADTREIVVSHPLTVGTDGVQCTLTASPSNLPATYKNWTPAEWAATTTHSFPVPAGIVESGSYKLYIFECRSGRISRLETARWALKESRTAGAVITLSDDPAKQTSFSTSAERSAGSGPTRVVRPGDRIVLKAEPGAWLLPADSPTVTVGLRPITDDGATLAPTIELPDAAISADGSEASWTIPTGLVAPYVGPRVVMDFVSTRVIPLTETSPLIRHTARWATIVSVAPSSAISSTTKISLARTTTIPSVPGKLAIRVSAAGGVPVSTVTVTINGVATVYPRLRSDGTANVTLPKLSPGYYQLQAQYPGTALIQSSTSSPVQLRVLG